MISSRIGIGGGWSPIVTILLFAPSLWGAPPLVPSSRGGERERAERLAEGIAFYRDLEYERALASFREVLARPGLSRRERAETLVAIGAIEVVLDEGEGAMKAFLDAFEADPDIRLFPPFQEAPKIRERFVAAQKRFQEEIGRSDQESPRIFFTPLSARIRGNEPLRVEATVVDNVKVEEVRFAFRRSGDFSFSSIRMTALSEDRYLASVPSFMVTGKALEYYLEARDIAGNLTLDGNETHPYVVEVVAPRTPWYRSGFAWIAAAGTAASIFALYLVVRQDPDVLALDGTIETTIGEVTTTPGVLDGR